MNFKKKEHENRLISKFFNIEKNPNIKNKKCKFLINDVGVWGWFPKIILGHPSPPKNIKEMKQDKILKNFFYIKFQTP